LKRKPTSLQAAPTAPRRSALASGWLRGKLADRSRFYRYEKIAAARAWGRWTFRGGKVQRKTDKSRELPDIENHQSTLVDWQLDCSRKVRIDEALGVSRQINDFLEAIEDDEGVYRVSVSEIEESLGSRKLGSEIRTRLENYLNAGAQFVVLDFKGVGVVSSSFADEVLAKLASGMGELEYRRRVIVDNASVTNRGLIERAISLRLGEADSGD
jgi:hypothetical protein